MTTTTRLRTRTSRRLVAALASASAGLALSLLPGLTAAPASAADYDDYQGWLRTPSGALARATLECGTNGVLTILAGANRPPQLYSYRATNTNGVTTGWVSWQNLTTYTRHPIITRPGYWLVQVQVAHNTGYGWSLDQEFAPVTSQPPGYSNYFYCKVTG